MSLVSSWMGDPSWSRSDWVGHAHSGYYQNSNTIGRQKIEISLKAVYIE